VCVCVCVCVCAFVCTVVYRSQMLGTCTVLHAVNFCLLKSAVFILTVLY